ncbi:LOW QUALITY PROTEIN: F-box/LRR-repeat protein 12 [Podargus strigoides]
MAEAEGAELPALPDLVLLRILELLPLRDRLRAARVCRRWKRLALDGAVWRHVDLSPHRLSSHTLWHLLRHRLRATLRSLRLRGNLCSGSKPRLLSPALLTALGTRCPHLRHLYLAETDLRPLPYPNLPLPLTALELSRCEIPSAWFCSPTALPRLRHLVIHDVPAFTDRHLLNVSSQNHLKSLSLSGTYRLTATGIQRAAPFLEDLEHLTLRRCGVGDSAPLGQTSPERLRFLELTHDSSLTDAGLEALGGLRHLEVLCLHLGDQIAPGAVVALCRTLPQLRNLKLSSAGVEGEVVDEIRASLPHCSLSHAP